jgi:hypothetical protein
MTLSNRPTFQQLFNPYTPLPRTMLKNASSEAKLILAYKLLNGLR